MCFGHESVVAHTGDKGLLCSHKKLDLMETIPMCYELIK
jgi:hypothetical protein